MADSPMILVVDDDALSLESFCSMIRGLRLDYRGFASAEALLEFYADQPGCIIASDCLPGMGGLELQTELQHRGFTAPIILTTARPETSLIVEAMRNGAVAVLDKPCTQESLWKALETALAVDSERRYRRGRTASMQQRLASLTDQERDVMWQIVDGSPNKITARRLGVSVRTIENRRRSIFAKLGIRSVAELVTTVIQTTSEESRPVWFQSNSSLSMVGQESLLCTAG
jgi:two-component system response regulator FixJ